MRSIVKLRIFLWLILISVVGWVLYMGIVPSGRITYIQDFKKQNYFIKKLTPPDRVGDILDGVQKITGDPIYFSLRTPRRFNKVILTVEYKNKSDWPIVEAGVLVDKQLWRYNLYPLENIILDRLMEEWGTTAKEGITFLQRDKKYETLEDFLNSDFDPREVALYNYNLKNNFILPSYKASPKEKVIDYDLRGSWQILTYVKEEDLNFKFDLLSLSKNKDKDDVDFNIYYDGELIDSIHVNDNGPAGDSGEVYDMGEHEIKLSGLPEGAYKIELKVNNDIVTKKITTTQSKIVFENIIWLFGENTENISLITDSRSINTQTTNPGSLQNIEVGDDEINLSETYKQFGLKLSGSLNTIRLGKNDVVLSGDGVFGFDKNSFFNPNFKKITKDFQPEQENIKYIIARYTSPEIINDWKKVKVEFDVSNAYREFYKYSFLVSIPGLRSDDEINDYIEIGEVRVDLEGTSLMEKIKKYFDL